MDETELTFVLKMRDEAVRVLNNFEKELRETGAISKNTTRDLKTVSGAMDGIAGNSKDAQNSIKGVTQRLKEMAGGTAVLLAARRAVTETVREYAELNAGMSDVRKTTGLSSTDLQQMQGDLQSLSISLATSTDSLTQFAATAGRAGISSREEIMGFTEAAAQMQLALDNIDPEAFLRFLGNTKTPITDIKQVAAALNTLDDTSKTSAERIMFLATDVSAAGSQFKFAAQDVLSWSTILAEAGVDAGISSTTIARLGATIDKAAAEGGARLQSLAGIAGMASDQFQKLAQTDMASAINAIIGGLGKIREQNAATYYGALKEFKLDQLETQKAISVLTTKYEQLNDVRSQAFNQDSNAQRWQNEIKVQLEKYDNVKQQFQNALDNFQAALGAELADALVPLMKASTEVLVTMLEIFNSLPDGIQKFIVLGTVGAAAIGGIAGLVGRAGIGFGVLSAGIGTTTVATTGLRVATVGLSTAMRLIPWVAAASLAATAAVAIYDYATSESEAEKQTRQLIDTSILTHFNDAAEGATSTSDSLTELATSAAQAAVTMEDAKAMLDKINKSAKEAEKGQKQAGVGAITMGSQFDAAKAKAEELIKKLYGVQGAAMLAARALAQTNMMQAWNKLNDVRSEDDRSFTARLIGVEKGKSLYHQRRVRDQTEEFLRRKQEFDNADAAVNSLPTPDQAAANAGGGGGGGGAPSFGGGGGGKPSRSGSSAAKTDGWKDRLADLKRETDQLRAQADAVQQLKDDNADLTGILDAQKRIRGDAAGSTMSDVRAQEYLFAVIEETARKREETKDKNAQLTDEEVKAVYDQVAAQQALDDAQIKAESSRTAMYDIQLAQESLSVVGMELKQRQIELAVIQAINNAKREGRTLTIDEQNDIRRAEAAKIKTDEAYAADANTRDARNSAEYDRAMINLIGVDSQARRERIAILRVETDARRQNRDATKDEIEAARAAAAASWELDEATRQWNDYQAERMATFDAVAGALTDFATGAKSAKDSVNDLIKALIDLIIQYQILGPIRRAFEQSGGSGPSSGGGGFLSSLFNVGAALLGGGGFADGAAFRNGRLVPFANGGVFDSPTLFPMSSGRTGVMGEAGPEAIMPLRRDKNGRLGVTVHSSGAGGSMVFSPQINVTVEGGVSQDFDPHQAGKVIGEMIETKMTKFVEKESRPNGMLWRSQRGGY